VVGDVSEPIDTEEDEVLVETEVSPPLVDRPAKAGGTFDGGWEATLGPPWLADGRPAGLLTCLAVGAVVFGLGLFVLPPFWALSGGIVLGVVSLVCCWFGGTRLLLTLGVLAGAVVAGTVTIVGQATHHYPPGDNWPGQFRGSDIAALVAFVALAADALVELVRQTAAGRASRRSEPVAPPAEGEGAAVEVDAPSDGSLRRTVSAE
jgi:hypothetical protein